jgi:hypothetical protein
MKKFATVITPIIILTLLTCPAFAKPVFVPGDASTIQGGIDLADEYDSVMVAPGTYIENITILDKEVSIVSIDGPETTILRPSDPDSPLLTIFKWTPPAYPDDDNFRSHLSGFTITGGKDNYTIHVDLFSDIKISENIFHTNIPEENYQHTVILCAGDSSAPEISRNVFHSNYGSACIEVLAGFAAIINNTFCANRTGFLSSSSNATALNNIVANSFATGLDGVFLRLDYNDVWGNSPNYG